MNPWWENYDKLQNYLLGNIPGAFKYGIGSMYRGGDQWGAGPQWMRNPKNMDQIPGQDYVYYPLEGQMPPFASAPKEDTRQEQEDVQPERIPAPPSAGGVGTITMPTPQPRQPGWSYRGWGIVGSMQNPIRGVGNPFSGGGSIHVNATSRNSKGTRRGGPQGGTPEQIAAYNNSLNLGNRNKRPAPSVNMPGYYASAGGSTSELDVASEVGATASEINAAYASGITDKYAIIDWILQRRKDSQKKKNTAQRNIVQKSPLSGW